IETHTNITVSGFYTITSEEVLPIDNEYIINLKEVNSGENINLTTASSKLIYLEPNNGNSLTFLFELSKTLSTGLNELINTSSDVILTKGNGIFEIHFNHLNTNYMVLDITGKTVIKQQADTKQTKIDLSSQPRGIYFVKTDSFTHK